MRMHFGLGLAVAALAGIPAYAADTGSIQISGTLSPSCAITAPPATTFNPALTTQQPVGSAAYQCNFIGTATLKFWSTYGGQAVMPAGPGNGNVAQMRVYAFEFDGSNLGQIGNNAATAASASRSISAANTSQSGAMTISLASAASVAGTYSDTIFMSIAP